jgi:putative membrane protein
MAHPHSRAHARHHFRVRPLVLRFIVNALALAVAAAIVPHIFFVGPNRVIWWILAALVFGFLNTWVKPVAQLLVLPLFFVSYGLVLILVNTFMLYLVSWIFSNHFEVNRLLWAFVGGLACGLVEGPLSAILGLSPPIVEGGTDQLREDAEAREGGLISSALGTEEAAPLAPAEEPDDGPAATGPEGGRP